MEQSPVCGVLWHSQHSQHSWKALGTATGCGPAREEDPIHLLLEAAKMLCVHTNTMI